MPNEMYWAIFNHLSKKQNCSMSRVCKLWKEIIYDIYFKDLIDGVSIRVSFNPVVVRYWPTSDSYVSSIFSSLLIKNKSFIIEEVSNPGANEYKEFKLKSDFSKAYHIVYKNKNKVGKKIFFGNGSNKFSRGTLSDFKIDSEKVVKKVYSSTDELVNSLFKNARPIALPLPLELEQHPACWSDLDIAKATGMLESEESGTYLLLSKPSKIPHRSKGVLVWKDEGEKILFVHFLAYRYSFTNLEASEPSDEEAIESSDEEFEEGFESADEEFFESSDEENDKCKDQFLYSERSHDILYGLINARGFQVCFIHDLINCYIKSKAKKPLINPQLLGKIPEPPTDKQLEVLLRKYFR